MEGRDERGGMPAWKARQNQLAYAGLVAIDLLIVQNLLVIEAFDEAATISLVAWAVALPSLAMLIAAEEISREYPWTLSLLAVVALVAAGIGIVVASWGAPPLAAVVLVVTSIVAGGILMACLRRFRLQRPDGES